MKQLEEDIKNGIYKKVYLLYGSQSYNRKRYTEALVKRLLPEGDTMNISRFFGKKTDLEEVMSLAETMPFMAERRVIVLEETGFFEKANDELADRINNIPDSCCMIFSEEKADMRLKQVKAVKSAGTAASFENLTEPELRNFVLKKLAQEHRQITQAALDLFLTRCGDDLWQVSNELEKIISYTFMKDGIREADVDAVCPPLPEDRIFVMIDAILAGDTKKALDCYKDLLLLRSDPLRILNLIREQLRLMYHVRGISADNVSLGDMAATLKMREPRVKMALQASRKNSKINLKELIEKCADTDCDIKNGLVNAQIGLEMLIIGISTGK